MSQSPDNRLIRVRSAAQEATNFQMTDDEVRAFIRLRDQGASRDAIMAEMAIEPEVADELISADESYAVARRISSGELAMYPPPEPGQQVVDTRAGSDWIPIVVLVAVLGGVIVVALLR